MAKPVILLVEDNPDDVELTRLALEETHVTNEMIVIDNGQEALDWLLCTGKYEDRAPCYEPTVVLLDIKLPKLSGLDVLKRMREHPHTKCVPVVLLTTSKEEKDVTRGYNLGANSYIQKPVDYTQFLEAIRQLGIYWMMLNEPAPPCESA